MTTNVRFFFITLDDMISLEQIMCHIPGVYITLDDMIISGDTDEIRFENIYKVIQILSKRSKHTYMGIH